MKAGGLKAYVSALVATVLFPLLWLRSLRLARRHADADPRGPLKVMAAIAVGVGILLAGAFVLVQFQANAVDGMYGSMDTRLQVAVGEKDYNDNVATANAAAVAIPIIQKNLANATDEAKRADLQAALNATIEQRDTAVANVAKLTPNHQLYTRLQPMVADQDDDAIRAEVARAQLTAPADQAAVEGAIAVKDTSVKDMQRGMWLFVWPSLVGAFFAPMAFAMGSILKAAFAESDTVGFKRYPGAAAGLFLLFGAFGLPSIPFAAWVFMDAENRSVEGQIAL